MIYFKLNKTEKLCFLDDFATVFHVTNIFKNNKSNQKRVRVRRWFQMNAAASRAEH